MITHLDEFERISMNTRTDDPFATVGTPSYDASLWLKDRLTDKGRTADYDDRRETTIQIHVPETGTKPVTTRGRVHLLDRRADLTGYPVT